jgi:predicted MFS family arabinose efflux permease
VLFALWLMVFSSGTQVMLITPIFPRVREQLGIGDGALGTLIAVDAVMLGLVALVAGPISDRIGRRRILLIGCGLLAVALALHALAFDYVSLLVVRAFAGAAGGILSGAAVAYVGDYFPYRRRGWANGWVMTGMAAGHIIGIPLGTVLAAQFGFRIPYLIYAATTALTFLLVLRRVPQPVLGHDVHPLTLRNAVHGYLELLRSPSVMAAVATFCMTFLGISLFVVYLPTWLEDSVGASPAQVATLFFAGGVANVLTGPRAGHLSDRVGRKRVIIGATIGLSLLVCAITFIVTNAMTAYLVFACVMMLAAARIGPIQALLTQLVRGDRRGSLMSLAVGIGQLGFAVGGALAGVVYARYGFRMSTALSAAFLLMTAWILGRYVPEPHGIEGH